MSASKEWIGGPEVKPTISLQLFRNGTPYLDPVELISGESIAVWSEIPVTDERGNEYTYTVDEVFTPENYRKEISEDGLSITNTYVSPLVDILGTKVWVDGPKVKPAIKLQLFRDGIAHLDPVVLVDGTTTHTWLDLDETDTDGKPYVYSIDEIDVDKNYVKEVSEDGLTVTNTYIPEKIVKPIEKPKAPTPVTGVRTYDNLFYTHTLAISMFGLLLLLRKKREIK